MNRQRRRRESRRVDVFREGLTAWQRLFEWQGRFVAVDLFDTREPPAQESTRPRKTKRRLPDERIPSHILGNWPENRDRFACERRRFLLRRMFRLGLRGGGVQFLFIADLDGLPNEPAVADSPAAGTPAETGPIAAGPAVALPRSPGGFDGIGKVDGSSYEWSILDAGLVSIEFPVDDAVAFVERRGEAIYRRWDFRLCPVPEPDPPLAETRPPKP